MTFDGGEKSHDLTRCLKDGSGGSFTRIINNIEEIVKNVDKNRKFNFAIRINFMKNTYEEVSILIDKLTKIINGDKRFYIYCRPVYAFETARDTLKSLESNIFSLEEGLDVQMKLSLYANRKQTVADQVNRINTYLPMPTNCWCNDDKKNNIIVGADGVLYFCDSLVGDEKFSIGVLNEDGTINYNSKNAKCNVSVFDYSDFSECKLCKCLPICMGGCRRERVYLNSKTPCLFNEADIYRFMKMFYTNEGDYQ